MKIEPADLLGSNVPQAYNSKRKPWYCSYSFYLQAVTKILSTILIFMYSMEAYKYVIKQSKYGPPYLNFDFYRCITGSIISWAPLYAMRNLKSFYIVPYLCFLLLDMIYQGFFTINNTLLSYRWEYFTQTQLLESEETEHGNNVDIKAFNGVKLLTIYCIFLVMVISFLTYAYLHKKEERLRRKALETRVLP